MKRGNVIHADDELMTSVMPILAISSHRQPVVRISGMIYVTLESNVCDAMSGLAEMVQNTIEIWLKKLDKKQSTNSSKTKTKSSKR